MTTHYVGWDIGGAHLKVSLLDSAGKPLAIQQVGCPLWRGTDELARAAALVEFPITEMDGVHAITMTGELCDIFPNREQGVLDIVGLVENLLPAGVDTRIYAGYEGWLTPQAVSLSNASAVASANWLALSAYTADLMDDGLLIDVGSTTTDLIQVAGGELLAQGADDASRLAAGELIYAGVTRTPVAALCRSVPYGGQWRPLTREYFANAADVYRLLKKISEYDDLMPSADGRGKDVIASAQRLARMLGMDGDPNDLAAIGHVAGFIAESQLQELTNSIYALASRCDPSSIPLQMVGAGVGRFMVEQAARRLDVPYQNFANFAGVSPELADAAAVCAPALAVAKLAWMTT